MVKWFSAAAIFKKQIHNSVLAISLHQIEKIMTLIDAGIELSQEHQPGLTGKSDAKPQRDKENISFSPVSRNRACTEVDEF